MFDLSSVVRKLRLRVLHLTGSWRTTRVWLQLVVLLFVATFIVVINEPIARDSDLLTQAYLVLSIATFGGDWSLPQNGAIPTSLSFEILRIIVPLVALGGLLLVGFRSIGHWAQFRLMPKRGHTVVFGLGNAGMAYVNHWRSLSKKLSHGAVLVVERDSENPNIARVRAMGIPVIISDVSNDSWSAFRKTRCHRAARIVSMMNADSRDIELTLHVQRYLKQEATTRKPKLFVQINEPKLAKRLSDYPRICSSDLIDLRFESLYSLFAEDLFLRHPPEVYADLFAEKRPHIAIHGYNDLGEQVLSYCALLCHYRNHQIAKVTVYDNNPERAEQAIRERHPGLLEGVGDGYQAPLELHIRPEGKTETNAGVSDPVTQHVICELDEEEAFTRALNLRAESLHQKKGNAPIFVKSASTEGLAALLDSNTGEAEIPDGIYPFGMLDEVSDPEILDNSELDRISKGIHEFAYRPVYGDAPWSDLDADKRRSNRHAALHMDTKFRAAGWRRILKRDTGVFRDESTFRIQSYFIRAAKLQSGEQNRKMQTDAVLESLSAMEHNRWVGAKVAEGWVQDAQRFDPLKIHNNLKPWSMLTEGERSKDNAQVRILPGLVERNRWLVNQAIAQSSGDSSGNHDYLTDPKLPLNLRLLEKEESGSEYVVPVINIGIFCPRVPQKAFCNVAAIDDMVREGVNGKKEGDKDNKGAMDNLFSRLQEAFADLSTPETLAFTIITPLVSDLEQATFHYVNAKLKEELSEEKEREHKGFRPGYQTEALITLPLPYNFMTATEVFGEAVSDGNPGVEKLPWFPGGGSGLQRNAGKRNVRYAEIPLIREVRDFGIGPEREPTLQDQFEWTWNWIAKRSDFLIMVVDDQTSAVKAAEIEKRFSSQEGPKEEDEPDGLFPEPMVLSGDRVQKLDIRGSKEQ